MACCEREVWKGFPALAKTAPGKTEDDALIGDTEVDPAAQRVVTEAIGDSVALQGQRMNVFLGQFDERRSGAFIPKHPSLDILHDDIIRLLRNGTKTYSRVSAQ